MNVEGLEAGLGTALLEAAAEAVWQATSCLGILSTCCPALYSGGRQQIRRHFNQIGSGCVGLGTSFALGLGAGQQMGRGCCCGVCSGVLPKAPRSALALARAGGDDRARGSSDSSEEEALAALGLADSDDEDNFEPGGACGKALHCLRQAGCASIVCAAEVPSSLAGYREVEVTDEGLKPWRNPSAAQVFRYIGRLVRARRTALSFGSRANNSDFIESPSTSQTEKFQERTILPFGVKELQLPALGSASIFRLASVSSLVVADKAAVCAPEHTPDSVLLLQAEGRVSVVKLEAVSGGSRVASGGSSGAPQARLERQSAEHWS